MTYRILCVCTGNICRSPTAEGVLRAKFEAAGLGSQVEIDSAGTHGYHIGSSPDPRSQEAALARGYDLSDQRARRVELSDHDQFDLILAMDGGHLAALEAQAPANARAKCEMMMAYGRDTASAGGPQAPDVPDPYYGAVDGFGLVLDMIEEAADGLVAETRDLLEQR
ncbi:MAG: low molecular weight phosphotyrosine protein phosphatase [Alphaproteobacteria bacterium]|nr:low molecular weight phosphotyrosine protein phosphatase [Alphaproteobacteria bacterium SS10]